METLHTDEDWDLICQSPRATIRHHKAIESRVNTAALAAKGRDLSQFSHGLTGQYGTVASIPDTQQDADLRFWTAEHWPDRFH
jgi:hypothetical protein